MGWDASSRSASGSRRWWGRCSCPTGSRKPWRCRRTARCQPDIDLTQYNVIIGTDDSEVIAGTSGADFICGRLGDDRIWSLDGADIVLGDNTTFLGNVGAAGGADTIDAGAGDDEVLPGSDATP